MHEILIRPPRVAHNCGECLTEFPARSVIYLGEMRIHKKKRTIIILPTMIQVPLYVRCKYDIG
jgi:hypothetical protein